MTLGDVKAQALQMMGFDEYVDANNVDDFAEDDNFGPLLRQMWSAVNRCFADLETKRVLPLKRVELKKKEATGKGTWRRFDYSGIEGLFEVVRLVMETNYGVDDDHPFLLEEGGKLRVNDYDDTANYAVLYRPKLTRLTAYTDNSTVIDLPDALAAAVPYFVKSEVHRFDEPDEAGEARNFYEAAVEQYASRAEISQQGSVQTVYGML
ncbi:MAG: hypothetical protein J6B09_06575 [Clostridia bacterium]|nr:hypothetical protein [Clostridia bacterium]